MRTSVPKRLPLDGAQFDVVVIGGGINGVAVARECARAGRRTLLVEQHDFGSGTTSRSTRIIHGGLRYLEHAEIALVRESLRERERLLRECPHLVRPKDFLLAVDPRGDRSALEIRFGLWLYRKFARSKIGSHANAADETARLERLLDSGRRWAIFPYDDAQCEFPERLVGEWLAEAISAGAVARNYTEVLEIQTSRGRVCGAVLRELPTRRDSAQRWGTNEARVEARCVINATGPWADRLCQRSPVNRGRPLIGGVRGSHIVLPSFSGAPVSATYAEAPDGRPIFMLPWNGQFLVGTTEIRDDSDPARVQPSEAETEYLFDSFAKLFPGAPIGWGDIRAAFAGVRPLPFAPGEDPAAVTRRHALHDHAAEGASGMISIIGGKLTAAASLARACARKIGIRVAEPQPLPSPVGGDGVNSIVGEWARQAAAAGHIPEETARALAAWHGHRALAIAERARTDPALSQPLCPHTPHIAAEAASAVEDECAITMADILLRRVPVALGACWSEDCGRIAARAIGSVLGWNEYETAAQLKAFDIERRRFLQAPQRLAVHPHAKSEPQERAA